MTALHTILALQPKVVVVVGAVLKDSKTPALPSIGNPPNPIITREAAFGTALGDERQQREVAPRTDDAGDIVVRVVTHVVARGYGSG